MGLGRAIGGSLAAAVVVVAIWYALPLGAPTRAFAAPD
jgi:hypothetical protein